MAVLRQKSEQPKLWKRANVPDPACAWNSQPAATWITHCLWQDWWGMNHRNSVLRMDATFHPVSSTSKRGGAVVDSAETPGWSSASACRSWHLAAGIITATFSVLSGPNHWPKTIAKFCVCVCVSKVCTVYWKHYWKWTKATEKLHPRLKVVWWEAWIKSVVFDLPFTSFHTHLFLL